MGKVLKKGGGDDGPLPWFVVSRGEGWESHFDVVVARSREEAEGLGWEKYGDGACSIGLGVGEMESVVRAMKEKGEEELMERFWRGRKG